MRATARSFGINILLQAVLHPFLPIAFFVPLALGFATGWDLRARAADRVAVGMPMGLYMWVAATVVGVAFLFLLDQMRRRWVAAAIAAVAALHIGLSCGAVLGGHYARKESDQPDSGRSGDTTPS